MNREYAGEDFPLAIGEIYGYRRWMASLSGELLPAAIHKAPPWKPGINEAVCLRDYFRPFTPWYYLFPNIFSPYYTSTSTAKRVWNLNKAPKPHPEPSPPPSECSCGFYAFHSAPNKNQFFSCPVTGIIRGTGPTLIGTKGFRTNKAEVVAFLLPDEDSFDYVKFWHLTRGFARRWGLPLYESPEQAEEAIPQLRTYQGLGQ